MLDIDKTVAILAMVKQLRDEGSWTGETHVQKAMYFLDKKCAIPTEFDFILYKHGPYSFDLHESLASLFASCLLEHQVQPSYGPRIQLTEAGRMFFAKYASRLSSKERPIQTVANWFGQKGVADLEKLATALWVQTESPAATETALAERLHEIKPHIPVEDARQALQTVSALES